MRLSVREYFQTSIAKKVLMALSGVGLLAFVIGHLLGNLQIFLGQEVFNRYAAFLKSTGEFLWVARIGLLGLVVIHIITAIQLTLENRKARPIAYAYRDYTKASYASRTMAMSGFIVLAYIVYHLLHFTVHRVHPQFSQLTDSLGRHDVYSMVVLSFQHVPIVIAYLVGNFLLGMHLSHGISSFFQSLGLNSDRTRCGLSCAGRVLGWLIFIGYASIPLGVLTGIVTLPPGVLQP